ncbi:sensor histidine kinase [Natronosalvus rutilus]|uniref:histidine kinase n=1 Tax=Natronosalvus rutilus TaxID=2953753 RepID=A0A9E7SWU9_9EURY|nr:histidine kinase N-terminal 7TM domain-containing protein [Natronosalvus rutilus]UTF55482.1 PAS domain-containing protein [Natronosalvus rutilus]
MVGHVAYTSRRVYRKQAVAIAAAVVVPLLTNVFYVRIAGAESVNWTPVAFTITGVAVAAAIFRYQLLDIVPVARESVVETMRDGVIVLDGQRRIVDVNATAECMLEGPDSNPDAGLVGASADRVRLGTETVETVVETGRGELAIERAGTTQHVAIRSEPITTGSDATLVTIQDVTHRRCHERELERTNARLDEFASVVSHDLRNPLNIAAGYLDILETSVDEDGRETLDIVRTQHDRMQAIIDDALTLVREGSTVDKTETETLSLEAVAREAWDGVDTGAATLTVVDDRPLEADRDRLLRALENLFRNCVEHAGPTVSVAVGSSDGLLRRRRRTRNSAGRTGTRVRFGVFDRGRWNGLRTLDRHPDRRRTRLDRRVQRPRAKRVRRRLLRVLGSELGRPSRARSGPETVTFTRSRATVVVCQRFVTFARKPERNRSRCSPPTTRQRPASSTGPAST